MPQWFWQGLSALLWVSFASTAVLSQPLDLPAVLSRAAERSPTLKTAYAEIKIAEAAVTGAKVLANPKLDIDLLWPNDSSPPLQEYTLSFNIIDLFARSGRVQVAERRRDSVFYETLSQAIDLEAKIKSAYYTVQGHSSALEEQKTLLQVAELQSELAQRQRDAGNIPALELAQYKAVLLQTRTRYYDRQMALFESRQELARLIGDAEQAESLVIESRLADLPEADNKTAPVLLAEAMTSRPDLQSLKYETEALRTERGQQNLLIFNGTSLGYAYERETSLESLQGIALSMPLPIFDRRQGEKARLEAQLERQTAQQELLSQQVTAEVKTLLVKMANARLRVEQLEQLVPLRQEILELSRQQYNAMLVGTYQLLDVRGDSSTAVLTLADAKADYWRSRTELERALGRSILSESVPFRPLKEKTS